MTNIISKLEESHKDFLDHVRLIETRVEPIPSIIQILDELKQKAGDKNDILMALNEIRSKRDNWIRRISRNQKKLLSNIPASPTSLDSLWSLAKDLIPDCGYKEFRFRLHELEWLGLVKRFWSQCSDSWMYQSAKVGNHMIDSVRETTQ